MQRRWWCGTALWLAAVLAQPAAAQVRGTIFGPGVRQYPIALSVLKDLSPGSMPGAPSTAFVDILGRDLELSGLFRIIPRDAYIEPADTSGVTEETINFDNWSVIGALALVKGSVRQESGDGAVGGG